MQSGTAAQTDIHGKPPVLILAGEYCNLAQLACTHSGFHKWVLQPNPMWPILRPSSCVTWQVPWSILAFPTPILTLARASKCWSPTQFGPPPPDPAHMHAKGLYMLLSLVHPQPHLLLSLVESAAQQGHPTVLTVLAQGLACAGWQVLRLSLAWPT